MRRFLGLALVASTALLLPSLASLAPAAAAVANLHLGDGDKTVCASAAVGHAHCDAHVRTHRGTAKPHATVSRSGGFIGADLRSAYGLTTDSTNAVAIVDAYANPNAASDLAAYRAGSGLPALTAGQFTQYSQTGGSITTVPSDVGWGQEEMLDLEMVSAVCPSCKIVYVGATSNSFADLSTAVDLAATKGVKAISNSYGGMEYLGEAADESHYHHPGIAVTASSGDSGYGVSFPAASQNVTAVGGTHLVKDGSARGWTETTWSGAGSGCSLFIAKPSWQKDAGCNKRTVADVSAVADPATGVAVYDSFGSSGGANWFVFGGTSVSAPIVGAVYALSGNTSGVPAQLAWTNPSALNDVVSGSNGICLPTASYLCTAGPGYDGPTGNGTPKGLGAF